MIDVSGESSTSFNTISVSDVLRWISDFRIMHVPFAYLILKTEAEGYFPIAKGFIIIWPRIVKF